MLRHFDDSTPTKLPTEASGHGLGAVLRDAGGLSRYPVGSPERDTYDAEFSLLLIFDLA